MGAMSYGNWSAVTYKKVRAKCLGQCNGITKKGTRCLRKAWDDVHGTPYCGWHKTQGLEDEYSDYTTEDEQTDDTLADDATSLENTRSFSPSSEISKRMSIGSSSAGLNLVEPSSDTSRNTRLQPKKQLRV